MIASYTVIVRNFSQNANYFYVFQKVSSFNAAQGIQIISSSLGCGSVGNYNETGSQIEFSLDAQVYAGAVSTAQTGSGMRARTVLRSPVLSMSTTSAAIQPIALTAQLNDTTSLNLTRCPSIRWDCRGRRTVRGSASEPSAYRCRPTCRCRARPCSVAMPSPSRAASSFFRVSFLRRKISCCPALPKVFTLSRWGTNLKDFLSTTTRIHRPARYAISRQGIERSSFNITRTERSPSSRRPDSAPHAHEASPRRMDHLASSLSP